VRRVLVALGVLPLLVASAPAATASRATPSGAAGASVPPPRAVITFVKNDARPDRSELRWQLFRSVAGRWQVVDRASWRAGSGMLGKRGRNACARNVGWLPNGRYHVRAYLDYPGRLIKGRAFRLDDKRCAHGRLRHQLFLHTEQGARNVQCRDRRGDQPCRWEYPRIDDYRSHGCIKLAPHDLADLMARFRQVFTPGVRYPTSRVVLRVVGQPGG
jgi:hypothetical protein